MKKNPVLLVIILVLLLKGSASAAPIEIRSNVYRSEEIGIEFHIPDGWREADYSINGADKVKSYIYPSKNPAMIIFCSRDIWKDISPLRKVRHSRSDITIDSLDRGQILRLLQPFKLNIGELKKVTYGGHTYLRTSVQDIDGASIIRADAVFTVINGYCYLFVYTGLSSQSRHYTDFEKLLDSADYFRAGAVSPRTGLFLSLIISFFAAMLPTIIYKTVILKRKPLRRIQAKRAVLLLTVLPGVLISAVLFLYFENIVSIFVFVLFAAFNYTILSGGTKANVLSYSIEKVTIPYDDEGLNEAETDKRDIN